MQITEGVHRVDRVAGNVYVVQTDDGLLLVDTGIPPMTGRVLRFIERLGYAAGDVRHIVITHCDVDHIGGAAALRRATGASLAIHALDAPELSGRTPPQKGGLARAPSSG